VAAVQAPLEDFSQLVFAPRFARETTERPSGAPSRRHRRRHLQTTDERRWPWVLACVVLALLLAVQLAWAKRDDLIRDPTVGGWLPSTVQLLRNTVLGCQLPLVAAPQSLRLLASNVQAHPSVASALMISASVRNDASFTQPYPVLTITLSNAQGRRIAMRRLQPQEYLDDTAILQGGLAPGSSAVLLLEVEDPDRTAVAFEIGFQ
jgi:hypothetical protein